MNKTGDRKLTLPWHLLALDLLGALLAAWGIYRVAGGEGGVIFIVVGFLLMAPFALHIINQAQGRARNRGANTNHNNPNGQ